MPATSANSNHHSLVLSVHLMNYLRLADIVTQVFLSVSSSVTCPVSSWRQPTPQPATITRISVPQYISFTHPLFGSYTRLGGHWLERIWLRFSPAPLSLETTHQCPIERRKFTPGKIPRCVLFSCLTDHDRFFTFSRQLGSLLHFL